MKTMDKGRDDRRTSRRISFVPVNVNNTKDVLRDSSVIEREREELKQRREREKRMSQNQLPLPQVNVNRSSRIAEMYANIIRMSNENKINQKNTWNLDLINHMEDVIMDGSDNVETNFQKASSTLDASVKIYGYRVDDTLNTGYRILESLSSGEQVKQQTEAPKQSKKLGVVNTIDTNLHSIQMDASEMTYDADPLFHVMSRKFDEGGVKGLLLANLGVTHGWNVVFDSNDVIEIEETPINEEIPDTNKYVDIHSVFKKSMEKGNMNTQLKQPACKALLTLIDEIHSYEKDCEDLDENYDKEMGNSNEREEVSVLEDQNVELDEEVIPIPIPTHPIEDDWTMFDNDMGGGDMIEENETENLTHPSLEENTQAVERSNTIEQLITHSQTTDYSYFQPSLLIKTWAGPSYWKISKVQKEKKRVQKENPKGKKKQIITFTEEPTINPVTTFPAVKRKTDLVISDSQYTSQRNPILPNDFHYSFNNLIHLNCRKDVELRRIVNFNVNTSERRDLNEWELDPTNIDIGGCSLENPMDIMNETGCEKQEEVPMNEESGIFDNGVIDDPGFDEPSHVGFISEINESSMNNTSSLLKADRVVERISIAYATQATQVDIQALKDEMWDEIQKQLKEQVVVSFIHLVNEVKKKEKDEIANQFFFICLLHISFSSSFIALISFIFN